MTEIIGIDTKAFYTPGTICHENEPLFVSDRMPRERVIVWGLWRQVWTAAKLLHKHMGFGGNDPWRPRGSQRLQQALAVHLHTLSHWARWPRKAGKYGQSWRRAVGMACNCVRLPTLFTIPAPLPVYYFYPLVHTYALVKQYYPDHKLAMTDDATSRLSRRTCYLGALGSTHLMS